MVGDTIGERVDLVGRSLALLYIGLLGGCSSWLPESATQENQAVLYGEFYKANLGDDFKRADHLARKLELCGRQLYLKDKGFFTALGQQDEHGDDTSIAEVVDLFTEDACKVPDAASPSKASDGSRRSATTGPGASAHDLIEAGLSG